MNIIRKTTPNSNAAVDKFSGAMSRPDNSGYYHNPLESLRVGAVLILPFGQDESP